LAEFQEDPEAVESQLARVNDRVEGLDDSAFSQLRDAILDAILAQANLPRELLNRLPAVAVEFVEQFPVFCVQILHK